MSKILEMPRLEMFAAAKINLGLLVAAKLANGYHQLDTIFTALNIGDTLRFWPAASGIALSVVGADLPTGPENLVYRAANMYFTEAAKLKIQTGGIVIELQKNLPIAAGLGGGSSDAAACLMALEKIYPANINLQKLAIVLGADVSFFLQKNFVSAHATGIGELLQSISLPEIHIVLVNPGTHISAREAYENLQTFSSQELNINAIAVALGEHFAPPYQNDLQPGVEKKYPIIKEVKNVLENAGLFGVLMSGSGSTCFGLAKSAPQAKQIANQIKSNYPSWWVVATSNLKN